MDVVNSTDALEVSEDNKEYQAFVDKFKPKKTTDDCYTPQPVYEAVRDWCRNEYDLADSVRIIRPFYPGGDYTKEDYSGDCVVIDNPPFSILSEICRWMNQNRIRFFLFAPALTLFSVGAGEFNYIAASVTITYENGAKVRTSFVTNMGDKKILADAEMHRNLQSVNDLFWSQNKTALPKYTYPDNVVTSMQLSYMVSHGVSFSVAKKSCKFTRGLDSQKGCKKSIYGAGFLLSEKAAAEKTAAEKTAAKKTAAKKTAAKKTAAKKWSLSPREKDIISKLG